jgi:choline dehydrogenase-like flavoprotein
MNHIPTADVCVIGGGVAGALAAYQLAQQGVQVLVLEGGRRHDPAKRYDYMRQSLYGVDPWATKSSEEEDRWTYVKGVGGSGLHWGANVDRLHESDFELQSRYGIGVDWPIRYRDLEPYYTQAEKVMGVAGEDAHPWTPWRSEKYPMPPFPFSYSDRLLRRAFDRLGIPLHHSAVARNSVAYDGRSPCMSFAMCDTCPIYAKWTPDFLIQKAEKTGKVIVKPETRVTRINRGTNGIESVTAVSTVNGRRVTTNYRAGLFILAAHAFESPRLLLLSRSSADPQGLCNKSGNVGKYFATHLTVITKAELPEKTYPERLGFATSESHFFYETGRQEGGNSFVLYPQNRDVSTPFDIAREELSDSIVWGEELKTRVRRKFGYTAAIQALVEQLPYEENHISLINDVTDDLGLPIVRVTYSGRQAREARTQEKAAAVMRRLFTAVDAKHIRVTFSSVVSHLMGTCRMGVDPQSSVVDRNLKAHELDNLYIVGSCVFPTFGAIGPTLTIAALALRLADHVAKILGHSAPNA